MRSVCRLVSLSVHLSVRLEVCRCVGNILSAPLAQKTATELAELQETCLAKHPDMWGCLEPNCDQEC